MDGNQVAWCLLTSSNLSTSALGFLDKKVCGGDHDASAAFFFGRLAAPPHAARALWSVWIASFFFFFIAVARRGQVKQGSLLHPQGRWLSILKSWCHVRGWYLAW